MNAPASSDVIHAPVARSLGSVRVERADALPLRTLQVALALTLLCLAFVHLTRYPATWFDEGSHLHVPRTLVLFGQYADYSDGEFRYYGPTVGVGPTVMLPIAAAFRIGGVGLLQARVVMALYLLIAVTVFVLLARAVGGTGPAVFATLLILTSPSIALIETGRQVLGEVPGLLFLCAGLYEWFASWDEKRWTRLLRGSVWLGLACITKHVYLLSIVPGLTAVAGLNFMFYRRLRLRTVLTPLCVVAAIFGTWQAVLIAGLGPGTASQNLHLLQDATRGAALVFSKENMRRAAMEVISLRALAGWVVPALLYTGIRQFNRDTDLRWTAIFWMALANLVWYVVASAGWPRYAFPGLALSCLLAGRLARELVPRTESSFSIRDFLARLRTSSLAVAQTAVLCWMLAVSVAFLGRTVVSVVKAPPATAQQMAAYLDSHVPLDRVISTWEPEMSVLSNHRYHFPPPRLLIVAVAHQWTGGPPVTTAYDFERDVTPDYVLEGPFSRYVNLFPAERLQQHYHPIATEGGYILYQRVAAGSPASTEAGR